ncbi:hypothetical protein EYF80_027145 [Liparis tanakae]|uniref:Uncharacterized protein n=1 Tax=Liparis tanakae TaxID=230148 RepID=A0A4Z2H9Q3_9TELE|nr:hypothetical protein EYF80_027145 [Liparis tanakae]
MFMPHCSNKNVLFKKAGKETRGAECWHFGTNRRSQSPREHRDERKARAGVEVEEEDEEDEEEEGLQRCHFQACSLWSKAVSEKENKTNGGRASISPSPFCSSMRRLVCSAGSWDYCSSTRGTHPAMLQNIPMKKPVLLSRLPSTPESPVPSCKAERKTTNSKWLDVPSQRHLHSQQCYGTGTVPTGEHGAIADGKLCLQGERKSSSKTGYVLHTNHMPLWGGIMVLHSQVSVEVSQQVPHAGKQQPVSQKGCAESQEDPSPTQTHQQSPQVLQGEQPGSSQGPAP